MTVEKRLITVETYHGSIDFRQTGLAWLLPHLQCFCRVCLDQAQDWRINLLSMLGHLKHFLIIDVPRKATALMDLV